MRAVDDYGAVSIESTAWEEEAMAVTKAAEQRYMMNMVDSCGSSAEDTLTFTSAIGSLRAPTLALRALPVPVPGS